MEKFKLNLFFNHKKFRRKFYIAFSLLLMSIPNVFGLIYFFPPERSHEIVSVLFIVIFLVFFYIVVIYIRSEVILTIDKDKIFLEYKYKGKILKQEEYTKGHILQIGKLGINLFNWYYIFVARVKFTDHKYKDLAVNPIDSFLENATNLEYNVVEKVDIEKKDCKVNDISDLYNLISWVIMAFVVIIYTFFIILLTSIL